MGLPGSSRLRTALTALATALALTVPVVPVGAVETRPAEDRGASDSQREYVERELLVRFEPSTSESGRSDVRRRHELDKIRDLPVPGLELVSFRGQGTPPERARQVRSENAVRYAEPNFLFYPQATPGDDPEYSQLYGLHNEGQPNGYPPSSGTPDADIDAPEGWTVAADTEAILLGVIDTGVEIAHEDLADTIALNGDELPPATTPTGNAVLTVADYADTPDGNGNGRLDPEDVLVHYSDGHDGRGSGDTSDDNDLVDDIAGWDFHNDDKTVFDPTSPTTTAPTCPGRSLEWTTPLG